MRLLYIGYNFLFIFYFPSLTGETMFYFNVTGLIGSGGKMQEGKYDEHDIIRTVAIAQKFSVVTVVMYPGKNATTLGFTLVGKTANDTKVQVSNVVERVMLCFVLHHILFL